jgi:PIN domain nuclease of toxin-antitoxin system
VNGYLLDTQTLLFWRSSGRPVGRKAHAVLTASAERIYFSVASVWEIAIKRALAKLEMAVETRTFVETAVAAGVRLLPVEPAHLYRLEELPWHHRDPFDRLLAAQALVEDLTFVGADGIFGRYGVRRVW